MARRVRPGALLRYPTAHIRGKVFQLPAPNLTYAKRRGHATPRSSRQRNNQRNIEYANNRGNQLVLTDSDRRREWRSFGHSCGRRSLRSNQTSSLQLHNGFSLSTDVARVVRNAGLENIDIRTTTVIIEYILLLYIEKTYK